MSFFTRSVFRSRTNRGKKLIIFAIIGFFFFLFLAFLPPSAPSLALDKLEPTNKSYVSIAGKTFPGKPVFILENNQVIQSTEADSAGNFYFTLNNLKDGNYTYTVEVCNSVKKEKCRRENILVVIDQEPPAKPVIVLPDNLPEKSEEQIVIKGKTEPGAKIIASIKGENLSLDADAEGEFEIKTDLILGVNAINVKAVDNVGNESEIATASLNFNPKKHRAKVIRVIDGDTIKIEGDKVVRYIGIDTPETTHPSKPVQCYGKEAAEKNKELVEGKEVILEKDISETDKYGRLLRYVWLGDLLVNEYLVREGYAQSSSYPPDIKYQDRFIEAQRQAREEQKGL